jgi:hypothetical protein
VYKEIPVESHSFIANLHRAEQLGNGNISPNRKNGV